MMQDQGRCHGQTTFTVSAPATTPQGVDRRRGMRLGAMCKGALLLLLPVLAACAGHNGAGPAGSGRSAGAVASPDGAFLAYEHAVRVQLPGAHIGARLQALNGACQQARFGDCAVLELGEQGGEQPSASIRVRLAPAAVQPFIALAGGEGEVVSRTTEAEDLAQQVADTALAQARLQKEHETLLGYQQRRELAVADLLAISKRLAELEAGLEQAARDAAQHTRRIDTQLLTVHLQTPPGESGRSEIGRAVADIGGVFTSSIAFVIRAVAALVPVGVVLWLLGWVALKLWRRRRRA